jgi:hypothetical protein
MRGTGDPDIAVPALRALVAAALLLATTALMAVTIVRANAAGALAVGICGAYGQAYDFPNAAAAKDSALSQCHGSGCRVVETFSRGCAAFAVDGTDPCGARGFGKAPRLGRAQNEALRACYKDGGKDCVIRTFLCDAKG